MRGSHSPPFRYYSFTAADSLLRELDAHTPTSSHPSANLVIHAMRGTKLLVLALRDRTAESFNTLSNFAGWYPCDQTLALRFPKPTPDDEPVNQTAKHMMTCLEDALAKRQLNHWVVQPDTVMSARILVDSAKRLIKINPLSRFRTRDLRRLVAHEIDVHVIRAQNGQKQSLKCFSTGLPGSLGTEEGMALIAEEIVGASSPGVLFRQVAVVKAIMTAKSTGFREVFHSLIEAGHSPSLAWGICLRIKRGLAQPDLPGVYAKDSVYLSGRMRVRAWLDEGNDIAKLYVGKVSIDDPIDDWIEQGWVAMSHVPQMWRGPN